VTVDEYINSFPKQTQQALSQIRDTIRKVVPEAEETIAYRMPAYKVNGKPLVYFAGFKNHVGFYPLPHAIEEFKEDLREYKHAKGSIQFPLDKPMPLELIERMVISRLRETQAD